MLFHVYSSSLASGAIPIYRGDPLVYQYLPDPDAIIDADHFSSPRHLASYLHHIVQHPELIERHLRWRNTPNFIDERFVRSIRHQRMPYHCRICMWAASGREPLGPQEGWLEPLLPTDDVLPLKKRMEWDRLSPWKDLQR